MSWSHYDDCGDRYEFCMLKDDTLKKDMDFCNFSTNFLRVICQDLNIPVDKIGYGKWGGGTYEMDDEDIKRIENHQAYKDFVKAMEIFTDADYKEDEDDLNYQIGRYNKLNNFIYEFEITKKTAERLRKEFWDEAKEDLNKELFNRLEKWSEKG